MGGALAFFTGYKWINSLAGVFAISSFLNKGSSVYEHLNTKPIQGKLEVMSVFI
jgi:hypothetical protein